MWRACVLLTHLTVFGPLTTLSAADNIFQSDGGRGCFQAILEESGWSLRGTHERAAFLVGREDGSIACIQWPHSHSYLSESFYGQVPRGTLGIAHTHPVDYPLPSQQDKDQATRLGIPIYVITIREIYRADPGTDRVATVAFARRWISERAAPYVRSCGDSRCPPSAAGE
jgi:hypothetical protein